MSQIWDVVNPYSAGIHFRRQNPTSTDVRFWRLKSIPALTLTVRGYTLDVKIRRLQTSDSDV